MAEVVSVAIEGTESVDRAYRTIVDGSDDLQAAWAQVGGLAQGAARSAAPHRTGWLASTISTRAQGNQVILQGGAIYAGVIEWGWRARGIRPSRYMLRGILNAERSIVAAYAAGLEGLVAEAQRGE